MEETKREVLDVKDGNISKLNVSRGERSGRIVCAEQYATGAGPQR